VLRGKIQVLRAEKGFGFIRPDDRGTDVFFHRSAFRGDFAALCEGQSVSYELDPDAERPRATSVRVGDERVGRPRGLRAGERATGRRPASRERPKPAKQTESRRPPAKECQRGFVTKLRLGELYGFISADAAGVEIRFEPAAVAGDKPFDQLRIGDYVEFVVRPETQGTRSPEASYVREIERKHHFPQTQLSRHPRARRKKPTWR
jgi:CspA family cold shock protein